MLTCSQSSAQSTDTQLHTAATPLPRITQVADDDVDDPDLALKLGEGLQEATAGEIKMVVANKADADIYHSAASFEDIITNKDLLTVRGGCVEACWACVRLCLSCSALQRQPRQHTVPHNPPRPVCRRTHANTPTQRPQAIYTEMKFERPSKIQASTLPMILRKSEQGVYRDLIAQAHNGSGKTTCFVLAMLSR